MKRRNKNCKGARSWTQEVRQEECDASRRKGEREQLQMLKRTEDEEWEDDFGSEKYITHDFKEETSKVAEGLHRKLKNKLFV